MKNINYNGLLLDFYELKELMNELNASGITEICPLFSFKKSNPKESKPELTIDTYEKLINNKLIEVNFSVIIKLKKDYYKVDVPGFTDIDKEFKFFKNNEKIVIDQYIKNIVDFKKFICNLKKKITSMSDQNVEIEKIMILDDCYILYEGFKKERNLLS
jgi:hypothetical protein